MSWMVLPNLCMVIRQPKVTNWVQLLPSSIFIFDSSDDGILSTCKFPGCNKPCYTEGDYEYDFCGKTHAEKYRKTRGAGKRMEMPFAMRNPHWCGPSLWVSDLSFHSMYEHNMTPCLVFSLTCLNYLEKYAYSQHMLMELNVHILEQQFQNLETLSALDSSFKTTGLRL